MRTLRAEKGIRDAERAKQSRLRLSLRCCAVFVFMEIIYVVIYFYYGLRMKAIKLQKYFFMDFLAINIRAR